MPTRSVSWRRRPSADRWRQVTGVRFQRGRRLFMRPFAQSAKRRFSFCDRRFFAQPRRGWMRMSERDGCAPLGVAPNMQEVPARRNACACSLWSEGFAISSSGGGRCAFAMAQLPWSGFRGDAVSHPRAANGALDLHAPSSHAGKDGRKKCFHAQGGKHFLRDEPPRSGRAPDRAMCRCADVRCGRRRCRGQPARRRWPRRCGRADRTERG